MNNEVYHIYYDPAMNWIVTDWDGYATSKQFREGTERMLALLVQHQTGKVLADIKDMVLIGMQDQHWLNAHFLPGAIQSGFHAIALIRTSHYFNQVAIESISYKVDKEKLLIQTFDQVEEAKAWLAIV